MGNSFRRLFGKRQTRVLMLGLDNAGKSTVLHMLKHHNDFETVPTVGFSVETVKLRNITLNVWDVGGQDRIRPLWRHYFVGSDALIYVVDSCDVGRMEEAKKEFMRIVTDTEMQEAVVVILANKQDMPKALSAEEIAEMFDVNTLTADRPTPITVRPICAKDGTDSRLEEAIEYMAQEIISSRRSSKKKKKQSS